MAFAQVQVKLIPNNQGTQNLSFNGYLYRMKNNNGEPIYWRCTVKDCPATINNKQHTNWIRTQTTQPPKKPG